MAAKKKVHKENYNGFTLVENPGHSTAIEESKRISTIEIREYISPKGYILKGKIGFKETDKQSKKNAITRAKALADRMKRRS